MKVLTITIIAIAALTASLQASACALQPNGATNQLSLSQQNQKVAFLTGSGKAPVAKKRTKSPRARSINSTQIG